MLHDTDDRTLEPGASGELEWRVGAPDLASALSREPWHDFPAVFATSRREGEMSVGVSVEVAQISPTPPGSVVRVNATFVRKEGKLFVFDVVAETRAAASATAPTSARSSRSRD